MGSPKRALVLLDRAEDKTVNSFRFTTYNVLADGPEYALGDKFSYCDMSERLWERRLPRLLAELDEYDADIYAIQELQQAPYPTFERDFLPTFEVSAMSQSMSTIALKCACLILRNKGSAVKKHQTPSVTHLSCPAGTRL